MQKYPRCRVKKRKYTEKVSEITRKLGSNSEAQKISIEERQNEICTKEIINKDTEEHILVFKLFLD